MTTTTPEISGERADLLQLLEQHRAFLLQTVQGLSDDQARATPTVSALCLGGLVKHVCATQTDWLDFIEQGAAAMTAEYGEVDWADPDPEVMAEFARGFQLLGDEPLAGVLADYDAVAARTAELVRTVDLDRRQPLPETPWFEAGASWSNRRALLHIAVETAQHAGHADIIRESIDGQRTMA